MSLPPPTELSRQIGICIPTTPSSRGSSQQSDLSERRTPEEDLCASLHAFKVYLQHEIQFVETEIESLAIYIGQSAPSQQHAFARLREGLKIRFNTLQTKLAHVNALMNVLG